MTDRRHPARRWVDVSASVCAVALQAGATLIAAVVVSGCGAAGRAPPTGGIPRARFAGASDRSRHPVSSAGYRPGNRPVPAPARATDRRACGSVRRQPSGDRGGGDRHAAASEALGRPDIQCELLRRPGDARADGGGAAASGLTGVAVGALSILGRAAVAAEGGRLLGSRGDPGARFRRRAPLARFAWVCATGRSLGGRTRGRPLRPATPRLHFPARDVTPGRPPIFVASESSDYG